METQYTNVCSYHVECVQCSLNCINLPEHIPPGRDRIRRGPDVLAPRERAHQGGQAVCRHQLADAGPAEEAAEEHPGTQFNQHFLVILIFSWSFGGSFA